jgi:MHS family proline/betaine transporter-like MFS transporter
MLSASLSVFFLAIPLFLFLEGASLVGVVFVRTILVILGVAFFAPFYAWAGQLVPSNARYAIISLGYALGYQVLGSPTAALALWCFQKTGMVSSVAWYWMFLGLLSSAAIAFLLKKKDPILTRSFL